MTIGTALKQGKKLLENAGIAAPQLTAEVLLAHATRQNRVWLYVHSDDELVELWWIHYGRYLHQRIKGKPTQYITGVQEFYGRDFRVTPDVLIPRPETEHSVDAALELARDATRIVDIGTGSGAIAVTLALELQRHVIATDVSARALEVARANARQLGAGVHFLQADLGTACTSEAFHLVVSNPPYVPASDKAKVQREVRDYEPGVALYGGDDGLQIYVRLIPDAYRLLVPGGRLILEIGYNLADRLMPMFEGWADVEIRHDLAGLPRVMTARKP